MDRFRYRCEDAARKVTGVMVREARLSEIKQEMLNSQKLQNFFEENPRELNLLRHDRVIKPTVVAKHLANVPDYLLPGGVKEVPSKLKTSKQVRNRKRNIHRKSKQNKQFHSKQRRRDDPLKSFDKGTGGDESMNLTESSLSQLQAWISGDGGHTSATLKKENNR